MTPEQRRRLSAGLMAAQYNGQEPTYDYDFQGAPLSPAVEAFKAQRGQPGVIQKTLGLVPGFDQSGKRGEQSWTKALMSTAQFPIDMIEGAGQALTAPVRAYRGEFDPMTEQGIGEALNVAGTAMTGGLAAPKPSNVVGSAGGALKPGAGAAVNALDMSEAARLQRAKEMGFDANTVYYHGSPDFRDVQKSGKFEERAINSYNKKTQKHEKDNQAIYFTPERRVAATYADDRRAFDYQNAEPNIMAARLKMQNPLEIDAGGRKFSDIDPMIVLMQLPPEKRTQFKELFSTYGSSTDQSKIRTGDIEVIAQKMGYDGFKINNVRDTYDGSGKPTSIAAVFDPRNIRSVDAAFDPAKADSANLLYANGGRQGAAAGAAVNSLDNTPGIGHNRPPPTVSINGREVELDPSRLTRKYSDNVDLNEQLLQNGGNIDKEIAFAKKDLESWEKSRAEGKAWATQEKIDKAKQYLDEAINYKYGIGKASGAEISVESMPFQNTWFHATNARPFDELMPSAEGALGPGVYLGAGKSQTKKIIPDSEKFTGEGPRRLLSVQYRGNLMPYNDYLRLAESISGKAGVEAGSTEMSNALAPMLRRYGYSGVMDSSGDYGKYAAIFDPADTKITAQELYANGGRPGGAAGAALTGLDNPPAGIRAIDNMARNEPHTGPVLGYHGTTASFDSFEPAAMRDPMGPFFGSSSMANMFAQPNNLKPSQGNPRVIEARINSKRALDVAEDPSVIGTGVDTQMQPSDLVAALRKEGLSPLDDPTVRKAFEETSVNGDFKAFRDRMTPKRFGTEETSHHTASRIRTDALKDFMARNGYDSVRRWSELGNGWEYAPVVRGIVEDANTGATLYANGGRPGAAAGAALNSLDNANVPGIRAYHGSPHDFDRFDMSKIGTGEGAQAYGHGLYFAENEGVAKSYRDTLSPWGKSPTDTPEKAAHNALGIAQGNRAEALAHLDRLISYAEMHGKPAAHYKDAKLLIETANPGRLYEVNIKANPEDFLDWDKPLSQQSEKVRGALSNAWLAHPESHAHLTGEQIIRRNEPSLTGDATPVGVSQRLNEAGIPGIRYLDQGSRGAGEGSRNYVIFDDKLIEILRKYGLAGFTAGGAALNEMLSGAQDAPRQSWSNRMLPGDA